MWLFSTACLPFLMVHALLLLSSACRMDVGDDFFELTPEDFVAITRADKARKEVSLGAHVSRVFAAEKASILIDDV